MGDLVLGDYNAICDVCGFEFKASQLARRWDNFMVCEKDFEQRHPQDTIKVKPEKNNIKWSRPEVPDNFRTPAPADPNLL